MLDDGPIWGLMQYADRETCGNFAAFRKIDSNALSVFERQTFQSVLMSDENR
jgi:hypothetical protein